MTTFTSQLKVGAVDELSYLKGINILYDLLRLAVLRGIRETPLFNRPRVELFFPTPQYLSFNEDNRDRFEPKSAIKREHDYYYFD